MGDRDIEKDTKKGEGAKTDRKEGGGGRGMEREDKAVMGQGGEKKTNPEVIVKEKRPRSTTLSDGS